MWRETWMQRGDYSSNRGRSRVCCEPLGRQGLDKNAWVVRRKFPDSPTYAVMADTGLEHQRPISAADFARQRCAESGIKLVIVRNPRRTYLERVEQRGCSRRPNIGNAHQT
jgi:hypothetical protein